MITMYISCVTMINGHSVTHLRDVLSTWEATHYMDPKEIKTKRGAKLAALNPKGASEVSIGLEQKLAGPVNTYSSTTVFARFTTRCDPAQMEEADELLFHEAHRAVEHHITPAYALLMESLSRQ